jgi:hypothetical protein
MVELRRRFRSGRVLPSPFRLLALTVVFGSTAGSCTSTPAPDFVRESRQIVGWLHTEGTRLVDAEGRSVTLEGIQVGGFAAGAGARGDRGVALTGCPGWQPLAHSTYHDVRAWGFNSVRMAISWANIEPSPPRSTGGGRLEHDYNAEYLKAVDAAIQGFARVGIAVVLEFGQSGWSPAFKHVAMKYGPGCQGVGMPSWLYPGGQTSSTAPRRAFFDNAANVQQGYIDAWQMVAARYANVPTVVGFDIFNEPPTSRYFTPADLHLADLYDRLGAAIRSVNRRALLIFQDVGPTAGVGEALSSPPPLGNVVYSFHFYPDDWDPHGRATLMAQWERALLWGTPLYVGETDAFGYASPHPRDPRWAADTQAMLAFCGQSGISWNIFQDAGRWFLAADTGRPKPGLLTVLQTGSS